MAFRLASIALGLAWLYVILAPTWQGVLEFFALLEVAS